jgi:protein-disulfide isomerase
LQRLGRTLLTWQAALWAGGSLVLVLGALALVFLTGSPPAETAVVPQSAAADITYGPAGAPVVVTEYADFECKSCAEYAPMLAALRARYGDRVLFVYRFFPLAYHEYGMLSAQVAYAAYLQGKFWEMYDLLYARQKEWAGSADAYPFFEGYAAGLGLDMTRFRRDVYARSTKDFITREQTAATAAGVTHTPWFAVNGKAVVPKNVRDLEKRIEASL